MEIVCRVKIRNRGELETGKNTIISLSGDRVHSMFFNRFLEALARVYLL